MLQVCERPPIFGREHVGPCRRPLRPHTRVAHTAARRPNMPEYARIRSPLSTGAAEKRDATEAVGAVVGKRPRGKPASSTAKGGSSIPAKAAAAKEPTAVDSSDEDMDVAGA